MSKYTTELRFICEREAGLTESKSYSYIDQILNACTPKIFDFSFPIFDENYRGVLEKKILRHYYTREIGAETYGLWKHFLCTKMNEIMPYYNKLYQTELIDFNPLFDTDLTIDHTFQNVKNGSEDSTDRMTGTVTDNNTFSTNVSDESEKSTEGTTGSTDAYSDTPQGALTGVLNGNYLTNARKIDGTDSETVSVTAEGTREGESQNTKSYNTQNTGNKINNLDTTEDYLEHIKGKRGGLSFSKMIKDYRDVIINIDMMVIKDLSDLFLNLW